MKFYLHIIFISSSIILFISTNIFSQNFPKYYFSVPEYFQFEHDNTTIVSGVEMTTLLSRSKSIERKNIVGILIIKQPLTMDQFIEKFKADYDSKGIKYMMYELNNKDYILAGEINNINELEGTQNYLMFASTIHRGYVYSITVMSTIEDQTDWVNRIMTDIKFY